jgi:prepilin-type N-terminal cleavage/methylation domain-containing protein
MRRKISYSPAHGFTLVEILVALAVFSITAFALIGLFSVTHKTERDAKEETQATLIASDIMEGLSFGNNPSLLHLATAMSNGVPVWESIDAKSPTSYCIAYDSSCEPIRKIPASEATNPVLEQGVTALAWLTLSSKRSTPDIVIAEVLVASPPSAPASGRTLHRFTKLLAIP